MARRIETLWKIMAGQRLRYGVALAALAASSGLLTFAPLIPQATIDGAIGVSEVRDASALEAWVISALGGAAFVRGNLWWPALVLVAITALAGLFAYLRGRWAAVAAEVITRRLRDRLYDRLQRLPCAYLDHAKTGDLIQRCSSDVETLRTFLVTHLTEIGRGITLLVLPVPLMFAIDVRMAVLSLLLVPFVVGFSIAYFGRVQSAFRAADEAEGRLTTTLQENLTGIRVVRAFARQPFEQEKFEAATSEHRGLDYRLYVLLARFWSISDLICFFQKFLVLGGGAYLLATGSLTVGTYFYFLTVVGLFIWPVRMMGRILTEVGKANVAIERIHEILEEPIEGAGETAEVAPPLDGAIAFENVCFEHGTTGVLHDLSFTVAPGETVALLGPSGCGKTTIVNLLLRLYDYDTGTIRLDDHELRTLDRWSVRRQMAVVLQEPFLFSKSLRENVMLARPHAGEDELIEATTLACVHDSILDFERGYETMVGERGVTLSGGQRQRVALARALIQDPAILVLDDALSAIDAETEERILAALDERRGRHTTLVIAHRVSTLRRADRILVLEAGRLIESGTHESLLAAGGAYRRRWDLEQTPNGVTGPTAEEVRHV